MITLEDLRLFGADIDKGLAVCMGNEELYLRLVNTVPSEERFEELSDAIEAENLDAAFEAAHALKGVLGNLSLTPLVEKVSEITELLRSRKDADYKKLVDELLRARDDLSELCK
ncbi:Hpt domain-containing protein [Eubacterium xylanophilum]|uniref:Hpt domain-containing protein n=1 Tax=Eubacterium xylanophilum TaxID=39497 RepID=UPI0004AD5675|nr:Hpt domain-containing protein [Eubacterium xylanophilum]